MTDGVERQTRPRPWPALAAIACTFAIGLVGALTTATEAGADPSGSGVTPTTGPSGSAANSCRNAFPNMVYAGLSTGSEPANGTYTPPPLTPPAVVCYRLTPTPRVLTVGQRRTVTVTVRAGSRLVGGARVVMSGAGLDVAARTNASGRARFTVTPRRAGIVQIRVPGQAVCARVRIGVVGAFKPPLTG